MILCKLFGHRERMGTIGRGGFIAWYHCQRGCGWTAIRKGRFSW